MPSQRAATYRHCVKPLWIAGALSALLLLTGCGAVDSAISAGKQAVEVGQQAVDAGKQAVEAGKEAVSTGTDAIGTAKDTVSAANDLRNACDIVREAVKPDKTAEERAAGFKEAMSIVSGVVKAYPDVPGIADLKSGLATAREALKADPSGATLGITQGAVESACSRIPSFG